jgi:1-acyl-sn-glycerol-3-phosphate acyltransferase
MLKFIFIVISNIKFFLWMVFDLKKLSHIKKQIMRYRKRQEECKERASILDATSLWGKSVLEKLEVEIAYEQEDVIPDRAVVFISNHESYADIPLLFAAINNKQFGFVASHGIRYIPFLGYWIKITRSVSLNRKKTRLALKSINQGIELINAGYSMLIFPEGTRSKGAPMFQERSLSISN